MMAATGRRRPLGFTPGVDRIPVAAATESGRHGYIPLVRMGTSV